MLILNALCKSNAGKQIFSFLGQLVDIIMIVVPIILIIMGTIDFVKAVIAQKTDEMKKAQNTFIKRVIIAVIIFFVPAIVTFLISIINDDNDNLCMTCFLDPKKSECEVKEEEKVEPPSEEMKEILETEYEEEHLSKMEG